MPFIGNTPSSVPLTSADIADGIITSAKIVDGTIVNADINASAGVVFTKLASTGTLTVDNIQFPATAVASANANTLDDYEEGTFNLTLEGTGTDFSSITYESRTGYYIKIGNTVYININFSTTALSGGSGDTRLNGLPFTSGVAASFALNYFANWGGDYPFGGVVFNGTTSIYPYYRDASDGAATVMQVSDYGTGGSANNMVLTGFYKV
jgi:hypothetical protein